MLIRENYILICFFLNVVLVSFTLRNPKWRLIKHQE